MGKNLNSEILNLLFLHAALSTYNKDSSKKNLLFPSIAITIENLKESNGYTTYHSRHKFTSLNALKGPGFSLHFGIEFIEPYTFSAFTQIKNLELNYNYIRYLNKGNFQGLDYLEISLKGNQIKSIKPHSFSGLKRLKQLDLTKNEMEVINIDSIVGLDRLLNSDLGKNEIKHLSKSCFNGLNNLKKLNLFCNMIE